MRYQINLVREMRAREKRERAARRGAVVLSMTCFAALVAAAVYATLDILAMEHVLQDEREQLARIETEYRKYKETKMIVDKADLELLDRLQNNRIFWTRKLAAMASFLPENYWITSFERNNRKAFTVDGFGYISPEQRQLITLDNYLNELRNDESYCDVLKTTSFISTVRRDEHRRHRVSFRYASVGGKESITK